MDVVHDILWGMSAGAYHLKWFALMKIAPVRTLLGYDAFDSVPNSLQNKTPLKVACVGFGRTGTVRPQNFCFQFLVKSFLTFSFIG